MVIGPIVVSKCNGQRSFEDVELGIGSAGIVNRLNRKRVQSSMEIALVSATETHLSSKFFRLLALSMPKIFPRG